MRSLPITWLAAVTNRKPFLIPLRVLPFRDFALRVLQIPSLYNVRGLKQKHIRLWLLSIYYHQISFRKETVPILHYFAVHFAVLNFAKYRHPISKHVNIRSFRLTHTHTHERAREHARTHTAITSQCKQKYPYRKLFLAAAVDAISPLRWIRWCRGRYRRTSRCRSCE